VESQGDIPTIWFKRAKFSHGSKLNGAKIRNFKTFGNKENSNKWSMERFNPNFGKREKELNPTPIWRSKKPIFKQKLRD